MKAAIYSRNGPPSVLCYETVADPIPGPNDVLIKTEAISIEGGDVLNRRLTPPNEGVGIVGYQAAGIVRSVGSKVHSVSPGDRVVAFNWAGSHAELFCVPEGLVYPVPASLDLTVAATLPVAFGTADDALFEFGRLKPGETVLVNGGAGGVGLATIQLAKAAGAIVLATASSEERLTRLKSFGMDWGINYKTADITTEALSLTGGAGIDLLIDLAGGSSLKALLPAMKYRGRVAIVGMSSNVSPNIGILDIVPKSLSFMGLSFGSEMHFPRVHKMLAQHMSAVSEGRMTMPIDSVFPLCDVVEAHSYAETGHPFGRVVMTP